jgi:hypothetical protein
MAKFGSASINLLLAQGVNLLPLKAKDISTDVESHQADTTGLGDAWPEATPVGLQKATLAIGEAFYDTATAGLHDHLRTTQGTPRVVCYAFEGDLIGQPFVGHVGAFGATYKVLGKVGDLTKAHVGYIATGQRDEGVILQSLATKTADWHTEGADSVDHGASSANGGAGYLHVTAFSGFSSFTATVRHSADDVTYATLVAFSPVTSAPSAQRVTVAGTVNRHLALNGDVTGSGSLTVWAGFARG